MRVTRRSDRKRFVISIYLVDEAVEFPQNDRLSIPLTRLFGGSVLAEDDKLAAATAWIRHVGQYRYERLVGTQAPRILAIAEVQKSVVASRLAPSNICPVDSGFIMDNGVEAWLISVRQT